MTSPPAVASTNVYTVSFDGYTVTVQGARRGKVLRQISLAEITAVEFKPARGIGGGSLRFRVLGKPSPRDHIMFIGDQQPAMAALASAVQRQIRRIEQQQPDPLAPWPDAGHYPQVLAPAITPRSRFGVIKFLILVPVVFCLASLVWSYLFR